MEPRAYDLSQAEERERWWREMEGYIKCTVTIDCKPYGFVRRGTDREGRQFALDAWAEMRKVALGEDNEGAP
jgi:hypothetical protein